jgi:hypothetical protein
LKTTYEGLNDTHLTEKLQEREGLSLGRETVRRIRRSILPAKRPRRAPKHRSRRVREGREGALVQIDGSSFDWLEGRGPEMTLVGAVDDATGKFLGATFRPHEDLHGYATVFHQVFTRYGLPAAFYGDGTNILVRNDDRWTLEEELAGEQNPTHLGSVLKDLGVRYIRARSPQAKGRIENRWGTLQDRLTAELRLRRITTIDQANAFLPEFLTDFNARFARPAADTTAAWRKPPRNLELALSCRYQRVVAADNTVPLPPHIKRERKASPLAGLLPSGRPAIPPRVIQIPPGPRRRSYARCRVEIRELLDGRVVVLFRNAIIASQHNTTSGFVLSPRGKQRLGRRANSPAATVQKRIIHAKSKAAPPKAHPYVRRPSSSHPWKRPGEAARQLAANTSGG